MLLPPSVKIYLASCHADMRKGHDGLLALVKRELRLDPFSGHLFVFFSRRRNRLKILFWTEGGFTLYYKRLEKGRFRIPMVEEGARQVQISGSDLAMLLDGIDLSRARRQALWSPRS